MKRKSILFAALLIAMAAFGSTMASAGHRDSSDEPTRIAGKSKKKGKHHSPRPPARPHTASSRDSGHHDHRTCENRLRRLRHKLEELEAENERLRHKLRHCRERCPEEPEHPRPRR